VSAGDVAAVVIAVASGIAVVGLLFGIGAVIRTLAVLRVAIEDIHRKTIPLIADAHVAIKQANTDLERVDDLLERATSISTTVDSASRLAYTTFSNPVVKGLALAAGVARAVRRLRRKR
jgi:hypothetical protein